MLVAHRAFGRAVLSISNVCGLEALRASKPHTKGRASTMLSQAKSVLSDTLWVTHNNPTA
jgi:hypothetical protein